jgi:4-hydroxybenzoate polyprenyltransferase
VTGFFLINLLVLIGAASAQALFVASSRTLGVWLFVTVLLPLLALGWRLLRADRKLHFTTLSAWCKWIMLAGVLSMLWVVVGR